MKPILTLAFFFYCTLSLPAQEFKVVGYLAMWNLDACALQTDWSQVTHLNLAFANPDADGNLHIDGPDPDAMVAAAHAHGVKVFISVAGGYLQPEWETAWNYWMQPENRAEYIEKIVQFALQHQLDGVDVDLEWQYVTDLYSPFVLELKNSLQLAGLQMTAALPGSYRYPQITSEALAAFDWVNLMIYDLTGPWAPNNPGPHSPFAWAQQCLQYWNDQGLPGSRQTLGLPFYGYDFGTSPVQGLDFREIVALDTGYAQLDQVGQLYYNGIPTIVAKTQLALQQTGGVMIWELGGDACGNLAEYSLLAAIDRTVQTSGTDHPPFVLPLYLYPNPVLDEITVQQPDVWNPKVEIIDTQGEVKWQGTLDASRKLNLSRLPQGFYVFRLQSEGKTWIQRFVKM